MIVVFRFFRIFPISGVAKSLFPETYQYENNFTTFHLDCNYSVDLVKPSKETLFCDIYELNAGHIRIIYYKL